MCAFAYVGAHTEGYKNTVQNKDLLPYFSIIWAENNTPFFSYPFYPFTKDKYTCSIKQSVYNSHNFLELGEV